MPTPSDLIGYKFPPQKAVLEAGRLRFFAKAIGETDPVYTDEAAAQAAGYAHLPAPPTFLFCLEMERPDPLGWVGDLGMKLERILHGEQSFTYYKPVCAGEEVHFEASITNAYEKKGGALLFVDKTVVVRNGAGERVADLVTVLAHRN